MRAAWLVLLVGCVQHPEGDDTDADSDTGARETDPSDTVVDTDTSGGSDSPIDTDPVPVDSDTDVLPPVPEHPTWSVDVSGLLDGRCRPCHTTDPPNGEFSLVGGRAAMVDVPSVQLPSMDLVEPGDLERSYLWLKLQGTQAAAGGSGRRMPRSGGRLDARELLLVQRWIEQGGL